MRPITAIHLIALGVDSIVGLGVYLIPGKLASLLGPASVAVFLMCGALLSVVALTMSRLARLTTRNGGVYIYASDILGRNFGFYVGWTDYLGLSIGAGAIAGYLSQVLALFIPSASPLFVKGVAIVCLLLFGAINWRGVRSGSRTMLTFTVLKMVPLLALALYSLRFLELPAIVFSLPNISLPVLSQGLLLTLFMCQGFEVVPSIAGEAQSPRESVPFAVFASLWIALVLYAVLQLGILGGPAVGSSTPLIAQSEFIWGAWGRLIISLGCVMALLGLISGRILAAPRLLMPLAEDGWIPTFLAAPKAAVCLTTAVAALSAFAPQLDNFVAFSGLGIGLQYLFGSLCLLKISAGKKGSDGILGLLSLTISLIFLTQVPFSAWKWLVGINVLGMLFQWSYRNQAVISLAIRSLLSATRLSRVFGSRESLR